MIPFLIIALIVAILVICGLATHNNDVDEQVNLRIKTEKEKLLKEIEDLQNKNQALWNLKNKVVEENVEYRSQIRKLSEKDSSPLPNATYISNNAQIDSLMQKIDSLHKEVEDLTNKYNALRDLKNKLVEENTQLKKGNDKLKRENDNLIFVKNEDIEKLQKIISEYNSIKLSDDEYILSLKKENSKLINKFNQLSSKHSEINLSFKKNLHLFYGQAPEFTKIYSRMDAKRLFRSFDPTLSFMSAEFLISHTDSDKSYKTTLFSCECDDFIKNLKSSAPCKHMIFLAYNLGNMFYYKEQAKKYLQTDVAFLAEKENVEKELKVNRKKLRNIKKQLKEIESAKSANF